MEREIVLPYKSTTQYALKVKSKIEREREQLEKFK